MAINRRISRYPSANPYPEERKEDLQSPIETTFVDKTNSMDTTDLPMDTTAYSTDHSLAGQIRERCQLLTKPPMIAVFGIYSDSMVSDAVRECDDAGFTYIPVSTYPMATMNVGHHSETIYGPMAASVYKYFKNRQYNAWRSYSGASHNNYPQSDLQRFYELIALMTRVEKEEISAYDDYTARSVERISLPDYANEMLSILCESIEGYGRHHNTHKYLFDVELNPGAFTYQMLRSMQEITSPYAFFIVRSMRTYQGEIASLNEGVGYSKANGSIIMHKFFDANSIVRSEGEDQVY